MTPNSVFISGGTGLIGSRLVEKLVAGGVAVTVLTRRIANAQKKLPKTVTLIDDLEKLTDLNQFDAVVNLAGEPIVDKRWSDQRKQQLQSSRWDVTAKLVSLSAASTAPPAVFVSGSAVGYYGRQDATPIDEGFSQIHDEYSHQLCKTWENIALEASSDHTRVCILRTGIVLAPNGGALAKMILPFKLGLGGPIGNGEQMMSWIHIEDMVDGIIFLLQHQHSHGIFNFTAPHPVSNAEFSRALASTVNRPCLLKTPACALKLAMGEMADLLIYGQNVVPKHLLDDGFRFVYPELREALQSLDL